LFRNALVVARRFTFPVVLSRRLVDGSCASGIAAFVVINEEGWIITAGHVVEEWMRLVTQVQVAEQHEARVKAINGDAGLGHKEKQRQLRALGRLQKDAVARASAWWSFDRVTLVDVRVLPPADLAVGRLLPFERSWVSGYPVFKSGQSETDQGTSLCRLGFPFHGIQPTFDDNVGCFHLPAEALPIPFFPIDGICTRTIGVEVEDARGERIATPYPLCFLETSSPGLRGQSGGPIVDVNGTIWAVQSRTVHFPLGFDPPVPGRPSEREHQFLNVGHGAHAVTVVGMLRDLGVSFRLETDRP